MKYIVVMLLALSACSSKKSVDPIYIPEGAEFLARQIECDMYGGDVTNLPITKRKWIDWRTYLNVPQNTPGRG